MSSIIDQQKDNKDFGINSKSIIQEMFELHQDYNKILQALRVELIKARINKSIDISID